MITGFAHIATFTYHFLCAAAAKQLLPGTALPCPSSSIFWLQGQFKSCQLQAVITLTAKHQFAVLQGVDRCSAAAVDSETGGATTVKVVVEDLQLPFGQGVKAVGTAEQMGSWSVGSAPALEWQDGHSWVGSMQLQPGEHKFKVSCFRRLRL